MFDSIRKSMAERRLARDAASTDWNVAEKAIKEIPRALDTASAVAILLPLSRGVGSRLAGRLHDLPATPTYEFSANVHLRSVIAALGAIADPAASNRLLEIIQELPNYAKEAMRALGSPAHAGVADRLAAISKSWPDELRWRAADALWRMQSEHAFALYVEIQKATGAARSDETMRRAWTEQWKK